MRRKTGVISNAVLVIVGSFGLVAVLIFLLTASPGRTGEKPTLLLYCAAGMKLPIAAAAKKYAEETFGAEILIQYEGSGTLLSKLQIAKKGDLYLAADTSYIELARERNLLSEAIPLARIRPVIAVQKGNPKNIRSVQDLLREDVKFGLANPEAASIGKTTKKVLEKTGEWEAVVKAKKLFKPTVNDIATDVAIGSLDAAVVWDCTVNQQPDKLDLVHTPAFDAAVKEVTIGVLKWCPNPAESLRFARYLQAPQKGLREFERHGYEVIDGDTWDESPALTFYSGGVNRLAIKETIRQFEEREGVTIRVQYNGCGILVGQILMGSRPDAYFACDASYMTQVRESFLPPLTVSETDMVIIVQKGNPKEIRALEDLRQEGLKLGVANEKQSALGALTKKLLQQLNLYDTVSKQYSVQTPTADLLVNQMLVGGLDAAIVYQANVSQVKEKLEIIPIREGNPIAVQPLAVGKESKYKYLMGRLVDAITSAESRKRFESVDFRWRIESKLP